MKFIKENPTLAAGIGLPVLLIIFFSFAALIPQWTVEAPQHDFLFTNDSYNNILENEYRFKVINGRIEVHARPHKSGNGSSGGYVQKLYRYHVIDGSVQEVSLPTVLSKDSDPTKEHNKSKSLESAIESLGKEPHQWEKMQILELAIEPDTWQHMNVPEIASLNVDSNMTSPDGYVFSFDNGYGRGGFFLFSGHNYRNGLALKKGGRVITISLPVAMNTYNSQFLGWIIPKDHAHEK